MTSEQDFTECFTNSINDEDVLLPFVHSTPQEKTSRKKKKKRSLKQIGYKGTKRGHWSDEEDEILLKLYSVHRNNWIKISRIMKTRKSQQVRDRFINHLDPKISKEPFDLEEEMKIYDLHFTLGSSWKGYEAYLPGRTADNIKTHYHSSIKGKDLIFKIIKCL